MVNNESHPSHEYSCHSRHSWFQETWIPAPDQVEGRLFAGMTESNPRKRTIKQGFIGVSEESRHAGLPPTKT